MNLYAELFQAMNDEGIRYLVVGGVAVNLHGYSRFTGDVDILLALDAANLERVHNFMNKKGYVQRLPIDVRSLSDRAQVQKWLEEKGMTAYTYIDSHLPQINVDILAGESLNFDKYDQQKITVEAWSISIPVVSIDDLIDLKRKANRKQDGEDIAALLELKSL